MFQLLLRAQAFHSRFQWLFLQTAHIAPCRSPADSKTKFSRAGATLARNEARSADIRESRCRMSPSAHPGYTLKRGNLTGIGRNGFVLRESENGCIEFDLASYNRMRGKPSPSTERSLRLARRHPKRLDCTLV
jgi:hypothetical protein